MKSVPLLLILFLYVSVVLAASENIFADTTETLPDFDCDAMVYDINIEKAINITAYKFEMENEKSWFESGMGYLDDFHAGMTQTVHVFSANADRQLASWAGDENGTKHPRETPRDGNASEGLSNYFNRLFRDDIYLYSSEASYLIVRLGLETNKEEGPKFLNEIKFAISLPFTERHLQLFIGDPLQDEDKQVFDDKGNVDDTTTVGARYFVPEVFDNLKFDISAGLRGIGNPFVQPRIEYPMNFYDWLIRPVQYAEYSVKREFYEETDLYFDRRIAGSEMVRLLLRRSTETQKVGMQYFATLSYFNTVKYNVGFRTYISLAGETKLNEGRYENPRYDDVDPHTGVYRYTVGGSWKSSFLRKWLFFELEPRVDFDMLYNWRPNYVVRYWLEFYFGDM